MIGKIGGDLVLAREKWESIYLEQTRQPEFIMDNPSPPAYLVMDIESVPDGRLLSLVKYARENLTDEQAVERAQEEARKRSPHGSDFLPASYQLPVGVCVIRVAGDLTLQRITSLDAPQYRPVQIVRQFWEGLSRFRKAVLVTYNGRSFDLPILELAAFRYGITPGKDYFTASRNRSDRHIDLMAWLNNYGACHHSGGLDLLAKLLGKPGKMDCKGEQVYQLWRGNQLQEINDYCMCDTLDTYFAFLRTRVLTGELTLDREQQLAVQARSTLEGFIAEQPGLKKYLDNWGSWNPWP
jgi:hypothetical protein